MKTNPNRVLLLAFACAGLTAANAQTQSFPGRYNQPQQVQQSPLDVLHKALPETENFRLERSTNRPLRSSNYESLGNVTDFLLETQTGKIRYAVVPAGASASGDAYRLIPATSFDRSTSNEAVVIGISRDYWNRITTMTDAELPGRLVLSPEQEQRIAQQFGAPPVASSGPVDLTRASKWKGQTVHSRGALLGSVEDVILDIPTLASAALIRTTMSYPANEKFVVPFERLELTGDGRAPISTSLTRRDLQTAQTALQNPQGALQPTGVTSSQQYGQGMRTYTTAATTVQQALTREPSLLYGAGVQVVPESRLVLRGTAQNEAQRQAIEAAARQAAPNLVIENQLTVQNR